MADYCYCSPTGNACGSDGKRTVRLKFLRAQLLYDIRNYAFIEGDVMGEEKQHAQHVLVDIGEEGNVDRVTRILSVIHAAVIELLYPWTKCEPIEEEIDDCLFAPVEYVVELHVPNDVSRTTLHLLSRLIHEFMVYRVLADWLSITHPEAAVSWAAKAAAVEDEIGKAKNGRKGVFTRKTHPW
jgi:hypothetical protein